MGNYFLDIQLVLRIHQEFLKGFRSDDTNIPNYGLALMSKSRDGLVKIYVCKGLRSGSSSAGARIRIFAPFFKSYNFRAEKICI